MLAVVAFVAFWVIVAVGLVLLASRGGRGGPGGFRQVPSRAGSRSAITLFAATAIVFGIALPLLMLTGNHSNANAQVGGMKLSADQKAGRELFGAHCAVCHTLAAANAVGKIGPDLDILKPGEAIVLRTIENGCLPNPTSGSNENCLGQGVMPAEVVQGVQARQVASFVAKVAGNE